MRLTICGFEVDHQINSRLKHAYLRVGDDGLVQLRSSNLPLSDIEQFISSKQSWILKEIQKIEAKPTITIAKNILLFANMLNLDQVRDTSSLESRKDYDRYYAHTAQNYVKARVELFAKQMNLSYSQIKFRKMKRRWGSCSSHAVLSFNTLIVQLDKELIDYIVVHELSHLVHFNHSKEFHLFVRSHLTQEASLRAKLKEISCILY